MWKRRASHAYCSAHHSNTASHVGHGATGFDVCPAGFGPVLSPAPTMSPFLPFRVGGVDSVSWYTGSVQFLYFLGAHS